MKKFHRRAALAAALAAVLAVPGFAGAADAAGTKTDTNAAAQTAAAQNDPALAAILAKADAESAGTPEAIADVAPQDTELPAPAIDAQAIAGDWQLAMVEDAEAPYLYVDSTLHFDADGTVTIHQKLKNRDRKDDWTASVPGAQDSSGAWRFAPADELVTVRSYEDRPAPKTDLEDQISPWLFRYDDADRAGNKETHERTIHRRYTVTDLKDDLMIVALVYSDSDGCDPRLVALTYTRGLHAVTDADLAAQKELDTPWKTSEEAAAEEKAAKKAKKEEAAKKKAQEKKEAAERRKAEKEQQQQQQEQPAPPVNNPYASMDDNVPDLRMIP